MRVMRVKGVDVNVHWTVFVVGAIILLNAGRKLWLGCRAT